MIAEWVALPEIATMADCEVAVAGSDLSPPAITYLVRERTWRLERPYVYASNDWHIRVDEGFLFDLASIPRAAWSLCAPFELSIAGPLIHDALYKSGGQSRGLVRIYPRRTFTRAGADRLFLNMLHEEGVPLWRRRPAHGAVRLFGASAWRAG